MDEKEIIKRNIAEARKKLPDDTRSAIDSVDWRDVVLGMRDSEHFTFTQLEDLELETESLLCGLVSPSEYPKNLERKLGISREKSLVLLETLNKSIFKKIREVLEGRLASEKKVSSTYKLAPEAPKTTITQAENEVLASAGVSIEDISEEKEEIKKEQKPKTETPKSAVAPTPINTETKPVAPTPVTPTIEKVPEIASNKLSTAYQIKSTTTDHSKEEHRPTPPLAAKPTIPTIDPYREIPE